MWLDSIRTELSVYFWESIFNCVSRGVRKLIVPRKTLIRAFCRTVTQTRGAASRAYYYFVYLQRL